MKHRIGFMQGRLSPLVDGKIQAFPWQHWEKEFQLAAENSFQLMEWTLDQQRLYENPLMTITGQKRIKELMRQYRLRIPSLTGDCFMQAPFYKLSGHRDSLLADLSNILSACANIGIDIVVIPLLDNGKIEDEQQEKDVVEALNKLNATLRQLKIKISFESDFEPARFASFIRQFDSACFGVNYDIGNSASYGFNPEEEFKAFGNRIINVHVKDRVRGGTTVPLGEGDADFQMVFEQLSRIGYSGNYILQAARARDGNHAGALVHYRGQLLEWLEATVKN